MKLIRRALYVLSSVLPLASVAQALQRADYQATDTLRADFAMLDESDQIKMLSTDQIAPDDRVIGVRAPERARSA